MVFSKLWEVKNRINAESNFEGYLLRITQNHILNQLRATARDRERRAQVYAGLKNIHETPFENLASKELQAVYQKAVGQLSPQKKLVYNLRQEQCMDFSAIAEHLQLSPHTVKKHLAEAVKFIREYVQAYHSQGIVLLLCMLY